MLVKTYGSAVFGIEATTITIEVNLGQGVNFFLVGLPDNAVRESQQRIKAAFKNNDLKFPGKEITVRAKTETPALANTEVCHGAPDTKLKP